MCVRELTKCQKLKPSLFLRTQISKNGGTTELIQICVRYDVISEMWTPGPIRNVAIRNNVQGLSSTKDFSSRPIVVNEGD